MVSVNIDATQYSVYSISFLGLGRNSARRTIIPVAAATDGSKCFPNNEKGEVPTTYDLGNVVPVSATASQFKTTTCNSMYTSAITAIGSNEYNATENSGVAPDDIRKVPQFDDTTFSGLASIADAMDAFKVKSSGKQAENLQKSVTDNCKGEDAWPNISKLYKGKLSDKSENACANGSFVGQLTFTPAGFDIDPDHLKALPDVDDATWTRGYAVLEFSGNSGAGS